MRPFLLAALALSAACAAPPPPPAAAPPSACPAGRADCDHDQANGCEADLAQPASCGACGVTCAPGEACSAGVCRREHHLQVGYGACAVRGGAVHCWGPPLGPGDEFEASRDQTLPHRLEGVDDAVHVRFNVSMSSPVCATRRSGKVACWPETPAGLAGLEGVRDVAAYANTVCAVTDAGALRCTDGEESKVIAGTGELTAVVASDDGFFALRKDGRVAHLGFDDEAPVATLRDLTDAVEVAAVHHTFCALRRGGRVVCSEALMGEGGFLPPAERALLEVPGLGDAVAIDVGSAVRATGEAVSWGAPGSPALAVPGVNDARLVGGSSDYGCYERADGAVLCWGSRRSGRLGDGAEISHYLAQPVDGIGDATAVVVDRGTCVLRRDGTVACWGRFDGRNERGIPPQPAPRVAGATSLTESAGRVCAAGPGKPVTCFRAQLPYAAVATFEGLGEVKKAMAGWYFGGIALRPNGEAFLFDARPQDGVHRLAPIPLGVRDGIDVAHSGHHACVLRKGGKVACVGLVGLFEDGKGAPSKAPKPIEVTGVRDVVELTASLDVCGRRRDGTTVCFAEVRDEPKGKAKPKTPPPPRYVAKESRFGAMKGLRRFREAGLGGCVVTETGEVICRSQMGQAVRGTGAEEAMPGVLPVKGVRDAVDAAVSNSHGCAVLASGRVSCWGSNDGDALGGGESPVSLLPVEVPLGR